MKTFIGVVVLLALVLVLAPIAFNDQDEVTVSQTYQSETYGFSFTYPADYELKEYVAEALAIGHSNGESFNSVADVRVYQTGEAVGYESYDDFVLNVLRLACAADSPTESIDCRAIEQRQPFTTTGGLDGEVLYLERVRTHLAGEGEVADGWGPIFVFDLSPNLPSQAFATLVITPPLPLAPAEVDSSLLREIASTIEIKTIERVVNEKIFALVSEVAVVGEETLITVDPIEWLSDEAAVRAVIEDTECEAANVSECVPSMNNNFYLRNLEPETIQYPVVAEPAVMILTDAFPIPGTIGDVDLKLADLGAPLVFALEVQDGEVISLEEVYLP